jgi:hypothetical protein
MRRHDVGVVALVVPYHPRAWPIIRPHLGPAHPMVAGVASLRATAERLGVQFADLADPSRIPCGEDEFLDGDHATAECLGRALIGLGVTDRRAGDGRMR